MDVAAAGRLGGVDVGAGVDPDDAETFAKAFTNGARAAGDGANGDGVVAADGEDTATLLSVRVDLAGEGVGCMRDLVRPVELRKGARGAGEGGRGGRGGGEWRRVVVVDCLLVVEGEEVEVKVEGVAVGVDGVVMVDGGRGEAVCQVLEETGAKEGGSAECYAWFVLQISVNCGEAGIDDIRSGLTCEVARPTATTPTS